MKILYDHQIFAMQEHGGVSRYFVELARELGARSDIDLNVLAPLHFNRYLNELDLKPSPGVRTGQPGSLTVWSPGHRQKPMQWTSSMQRTTFRLKDSLAAIPRWW